jgi:hypothetical protein
LSRFPTAEPRIWFDPPAFSWSRVLRIGALWFALVLGVLAIVFTAVDDERKTPQRVAEPAAATEPAPVGATIASAPATTAAVAAPIASGPAPTAVLAAHVASAPAGVASAAR